MARRTSRRKPRRTSRRRSTRRNSRRRSRRPRRNRKTTAKGAYFLHYKTPTGIGKVKRLGTAKAKAGQELKEWRTRTYGKGYRLLKVFRCSGGLVRARKLAANTGAAPKRRRTSRKRRSSRRRVSRRRSRAPKRNRRRRVSRRRTSRRRRAA